MTDRKAVLGKMARDTDGCPDRVEFLIIKLFDRIRGRPKLCLCQSAAKIG
ncbi:MAG: hypothetical protein HOA08_19770 [Rhodospirillaceae bacterium]|jgi:hypothetical protein|nr:hypothetical protein [Rhodospirillaceae bacterium]MBT3495417.1 hypothetical protein [Rhodospirillaceae bacterium]MBT3780153.1 hypothetical protein [Rhodospirillaceae bacterium]MBT3975540.1 hypothetical protein [Rhodospirillaceae bacterium]MBT4168753.1 hypothetical protein [Rhodospirillaceae bacterium]